MTWLFTLKQHKVRHPFRFEEDHCFLIELNLGNFVPVTIDRRLAPGCVGVVRRACSFEGAIEYLLYGHQRAFQGVLHLIPPFRRPSAAVVSIYE